MFYCIESVRSLSLFRQDMSFMAHLQARVFVRLSPLVYYISGELSSERRALFPQRLHRRQVSSMEHSREEDCAVERRE